MPLFRIVQGRLIPPEDCKDHLEAWDKLGVYEQAVGQFAPAPGQTAVVVSHASDVGQLQAVPERGLIFGYEGTDVALCCAIDEDNGGRKVVIAIDYMDDKMETCWRIVPDDRWVQTSTERCLVRYFSTREEAVACVGDDRVAVQPIDDVNGWRCTLVHRDMGLWTHFKELLKTPKFIEIFQIPEGISILMENLPTPDATCILPEVFPELEPDPKTGWDSAIVVELLMTRKAEIFVLLVTPDGPESEEGLKVFTRLFSYDEAGELLDFGRRCCD